MDEIIRCAVVQSLENDRKLEKLEETVSSEGVDSDNLIKSDNHCKNSAHLTANANANAACLATKKSSSSKAPTTGKERRPKVVPNSNWDQLRAKLGVVKPLNVGASGASELRRQKMANSKSDNVHTEVEKSTSNFSAFMPRAVRSDANATSIVALDCEMVGVGPGGKTDALARVSVVNYSGDVLYDTFVKPGETVTDYRTRWSGVRPEDVDESSSAVNLFEAQRIVGELLKGRTAVGHSLKNDFRVLKISHPWHRVRDTSDFYRRQWKRRGLHRPALRTLVAQVLGVDTFQTNEHDSCEDARAALALYKKNAKTWEKSISEQRMRRPR